LASSAGRAQVIAIFNFDIFAIEEYGQQIWIDGLARTVGVGKKRPTVPELLAMASAKK